MFHGENELLLRQSEKLVKSGGPGVSTPEKF